MPIPDSDCLNTHLVLDLVVLDLSVVSEPSSFVRLLVWLVVVRASSHPCLTLVHRFIRLFAGRELESLRLHYMNCSLGIILSSPCLTFVWPVPRFASLASLGLFLAVSLDMNVAFSLDLIANERQSR